MSPTDVYRDGVVHIRAERCETCIFHAGNRMQLNRGRVRRMVDEAREHDGAIVCHETIQGQRNGELVCRGFHELHRPPLLDLADRLGLVEFET